MGILATLLLWGKKFVTILKSFLPQVEGFTPTPIWDYKQWSWGYGTAAGYDRNKKPAGSITREKAWQEAEKVIAQNYSQLKGIVKKPLNQNEWASLLSFTYNAGIGNARNIVQTINSGGSPSDVVTRMKKYIYAGGKINNGLINRREKEANLYLGKTIGQVYASTITAPERIHPDLITDFAY